MYNRTLVHLMAHDIAQSNPTLYRLNNMPDALLNVPFNYYLHDTGVLENYCKSILTDGVLGNKDAVIHVIEDHYMELNIVGGYFEKDNNYHIIVNGKHNTCWKRFALIKELCSLYVNNFARRNSEEVTLYTFDNYEMSLESSYSKKARYDRGLLNDEEFDSDTFAILLATELMIPPVYKFRKQTDELYKRYLKKEMTMNDIAQSLSMPEFVLEYHMKSDSYQNACEYYKTQYEQSNGNARIAV